MTLKSRPLFSLPQTAGLGAAIVAAAVFVSAQYGSWTLPQIEAAPQAAAPGPHPFGALVPFKLDPAQTPARAPQTASSTPTSVANSPWAITRGPLLEIDPAKMRPTPESQSAQRDAEPDIAAPLPPRRSDRATKRDAAPAVAVAAPAPDNRGVFERLFNINPTPTDRTALAYATPQDGAVSGGLRNTSQMPMGYADGHTAVYDIAAKTVILPNGEKLEAHSGLGPMLDDPNRVHVKNRGPTPPNVYELSLREQLFHGVRALRMNPVSGGDMYGRDGILAHTYMLGPNGDSNGCVSFKDYDRFLRAFLNGDVKRLVVVQKLA